MRVLDQAAYDTSFSFVYSPRPGTPALRYPDDLPEAEKSARLHRLQVRQTELTLQSHRRMVGRTVKARIESHGPTETGYWLARTGEWQNVHLLAGPGVHLPFGELVEVKIADAGPHFLKAEVLP